MVGKFEEIGLWLAVARLNGWIIKDLLQCAQHGLAICRERERATKRSE
jgi:hypothetical protein